MNKNHSASKSGEKSREHYLEELKLINDTVIRASRMDDIDEICRFIAERIHSVNPKAFVVVSLYDPDVEAVRIRAMRGFDRVMGRLRKLLGLDFTRMTFKPEQMEEFRDLYVTGKMERVPGGFYTLLERKVPRPACRAAERMLGIKNSYTVGFALEDQPYGGIIILPAAGRDIQYSAAIETLASHFSLILLRRQSEQKLMESEKKHRKLFETMAQGVVYQDRQGRIFSVNPAAERILGVTMEQLQGRTSVDPRWHAVHEDGSEFPGEQHPSMKALETGKEIKNVIMGVFHPEQKRYRWINVNAVPEFREGEDTPFRVFSTFDDITERIEAQKKLRESERRHKEAQKVAHIGHWELDSETGSPSWSDEIFRIFGLNPKKKEPSFPEHEKYIHSMDWPLLRDAVEAAVKKGDSFDLEFRIIRTDGELKWMHALGRPDRDERGRIIKIFGTAQDITKRKVAEERIRTAEGQIQHELQIKETLLQEIHHRVKNNFSLISSLLNLQAGQVQNKEDALKAFQESRNRIYSMLLVHEKLYKSEDLSNIDMKEYIEAMTGELMQVYQNEKRIDLTLDIKDVFLDINSAIPVGLILNELVSNALKHAFAGREEGRIDISFYPLNNKKYRLRVEDDGIGLPDKFDVEHTESLGMKLIHLLSGQIDGNLNINGENGVRIQILFPKLR